MTLSPVTPAAGRKEGGTPLKRTTTLNKPIMIYLHENVPEYTPEGLPLLVNLGNLQGFTDLLDDCTSRMKMHKVRCRRPSAVALPFTPRRVRA